MGGGNDAPTLVVMNTIENNTPHRMADIGGGILRGGYDN
jgi:hypothetical protein